MCYYENMNIKRLATYTGVIIIVIVASVIILSMRSNKLPGVPKGYVLEKDYQSNNHSVICSTLESPSCGLCLHGVVVRDKCYVPAQDGNG